MVVVLGLLRRKEQRRLSERNRNQKRRDKKGRILRNGESQRADGRYAFVYTDCYGKQKFLYSWKLESTDPLPVGRRPCQSLREKEKVILRDINDGITPYGDNLTNPFEFQLCIVVVNDTMMVCLSSLKPDFVFQSSAD